MSSSRLGVAAVVAIILALLATGCGVSGEPTVQRTVSAADCRGWLDSFIEGERQDRSGDRMNELMAALSSACKSEFNVAADYVSVKTTSSVGGPSTCKSWTKRGLQPEAITLLAADGLCTKAKKKKKWPDGGLGWNKADKHVG